MDFLKSERCVICLCVFLAILALGMAGSDDYKNEKLAESQYCRDVTDRVYPDYKGIYREVCK